jgi:hypothetical protein
MKKQELDHVLRAAGRYCSTSTSQTTNVASQSIAPEAISSLTTLAGTLPGQRTIAGTRMLPSKGAW